MIVQAISVDPAADYETVANDESLDLSSFPEFCRALFVSLARSDQRRWGEAYVRGLLSVPGRKSIRRISELVVGGDADQSLQQFVNQSPWSWRPVRRALAERVLQVLAPAAWVVQEVVFPKNGDSSVAVARQYAPSAGRMLNCQRAVSVFLAGEDGSCPVNWRLLLPRTWDDDALRRAKTRVPVHERSQPEWQYLLDSLDEMIDGWGLAPAPIVVDLSADREVSSLLDGLEERGLRYVARVPGTLTALPGGRGRPAHAPVRPPTAGQFVTAVRRGRMTTFAHTSAGSPGLAGFGGSEDSPARRRHVLAEWQAGAPQPRSVWLTNIVGGHSPQTARLLHARDQVRRDLRRLDAESGLRHFEGRSFQGWHHHVTLASAAHGYRLVRQYQDHWAKADAVPAAPLTG